MTIQRVHPPIMYPWVGYVSGNAALSAGSVDSSTKISAFCGPVLWHDRSVTSRAIRKVGVRFGSLIKAGNSVIRVSLRDLDPTGGNPYIPDGTDDQYVDIPAANYAANTYTVTGALSADRTVSWGEMLAVVFKYDPSGRLGSDSFIITAANHPHTFAEQSMGWVFYNGTSWAIVGSLTENILVEFADGTFGSVGMPHSIMSAMGQIGNFNSTTTPDERGIRFQVKTPVQVSGIWFWMQVAANTATFDFVLYDSDGTTVLASQSSGSYRGPTPATNTRPHLMRLNNIVTLDANTNYIISIKPTNSQNVNAQYFDVASAAHLEAIFGHQNWCEVSRADGAGTWTANTTRRLLGGLRIIGVHGDSPSGGLMANPGMRGGMI
jgi:hypothetical protein